MKIFNRLLLKNRKEYVKKKSGKGMRIKTMFDAVEREIELLKTLSDPHIVKLHSILDDSEKDKLYLILDYCDCGEIMKWDSDDRIFTPQGVKTEYFSEDDIKKYFKQIVLALEYLFSQNIVHRDIKPQNILLSSNGDVKIGDFGVAAKVEADDDTLTSTEGTYHFMPPECWNYETK